MEGASTRTRPISLRFFLEGISVAKRAPKPLTAVEQEVIADIRARRELPPDHEGRRLLSDPVALVEHYIETRHGDAQLHVTAIVPEIGISMRTLQRKFVVTLERNVLQHQVHVRLAYCLSLLSNIPVTKDKIGGIARELGYTKVHAFNRFFQDHMHMSPSAWAREEQERIKSKGNLRVPNSDPPSD